MLLKTVTQYDCLESPSSTSKSTAPSSPSKQRRRRPKLYRLMMAGGGNRKMLTIYVGCILSAVCLISLGYLVLFWRHEFVHQNAAVSLNEQILQDLQATSAQEDTEMLFLIALKKALIVDPECLERIASRAKACSLPIQLAVNRELAKMMAVTNDRRHRNSQEKFYRIDYIFEEDDLNKDFMVFTSINRNTTTNDGNSDKIAVQKRAIKKFKTKKMVLEFPTVGASSINGTNSTGTSIELEVPVHPEKFLTQWKNGRFMECVPRLVRNETELQLRHIPLSFLADMSAFAEHVSSFNVTPFIFGGTLLGWYRECSLIPHTGDVDFGMFAEQHSVALLNDLINPKNISDDKTKKQYVLKWILGRVEDSLELTVWSGNFPMDLFYIYYNATRGVSFTSGMRISSDTRQRIVWIYPRISPDQLCAVELHGHLFTAPCNVEAVLNADYGESDWGKDHPTSSFFYDRSHKNHESMEHFTEAEWTKVKRTFYPRNADTPKEFIP